MKVRKRSIKKMAIKENKAKKRYAMIKKVNDVVKFADYKVNPNKDRRINSCRVNSMKRTLAGYRKT
jgi:hypothetical protein